MPLYSKLQPCYVVNGGAFDFGKVSGNLRRCGLRGAASRLRPLAERSPPLAPLRNHESMGFHRS